MAHAFSRIPKTNKSGFTVDTATVTFSGGGGDSRGLLVQNVQIQYQQQISFIYDLTDPAKVYYVAGRAEGNLTIGKVVSDVSTYDAFLETFADVCADETSLTIEGTQGCNRTDQSASVLIVNPIVTTYQITMNINDGIIAEQIQMKFPDLEMGAGGGDAPQQASIAVPGANLA